jgi:type II secretory pathway pseudopilin PulG
MTKTLRNPKGQMLIEIVVAVGIIALVLVGVSDLMTRSSRVVSFQKQKDEAVAVAQRCLNYYRTERDRNPAEFYTKAENGSLVTCPSESYTGTITPSTDVLIDSVHITATVGWADGPNNFSVSLSQSLAKEIK